MRHLRSVPDVVVTGIGATTPLGGDVASTWAALLAGQSGVSALDPEWAQGVPVKVAAHAMKDPVTALTRVEARTLDRSQQLGLIAAREAWADAGAPDCDRDRLAVVVSSGVGGITTTFAQYDVFRERGPRHVSPHTIPMMMGNGPAAVVGMEFGARAGVHAATSACASGAEAIAHALTLLRLGRADVVVCGGAEAAIHPLTMAGFAAMRALSQNDRSPEAVSRPFDIARDGFVLGEGAGMLVLETAEHAAARDCHLYAVLAGAGVSSDSHHMTKPDPSGRGAAGAIISAIRDADCEPSDVVHVNAHATSTPLGDAAESAAIVTALGASADQVAVSAIKSMTGHLLGAAGAVAAITTILALRDKIAPPTRNLDEQDPGVRLDVVTTQHRRIRSGLGLTDSFGFGGHNVVLAFAPVP